MNPKRLDAVVVFFSAIVPQILAAPATALWVVSAANAEPLSGSAANYQGLWWSSPPGSEAGWGVNIAHQGDVLFATWSTYDANGGGMWLVMPDGEKVADATYTGALYRATGQPFSATAFDPAQVKVTEVGTATFSFSDADNGTFGYTVDGVSQSKPITRQVFSSPVSVCAPASTPDAISNFQDLWWNDPPGSESGWGVNITQQGNILFATWFTYGIDGKDMWLVIPDAVRVRIAPPTYTGPLYHTTGPAFSASPWDPSLVTVTYFGFATFTFSDANHGTFFYAVNGIWQSKAITRQAIASPPTVCQ